MICICRRIRRSSAWLAVRRSRPLTRTEPENEAAQRTLAGTGFADERECLTQLDCERYVVDSSHLTMCASPKDGFAQRINLCEVADFDKSHAPMVAECNLRRACPRGLSFGDHPGIVIQ